MTYRPTLRSARCSTWVRVPAVSVLRLWCYYGRQATDPMDEVLCPGGAPEPAEFSGARDSVALAKAREAGWTRRRYGAWVCPACEGRRDP